MEEAFVARRLRQNLKKLKELLATPDDAVRNAGATYEILKQELPILFHSLSEAQGRDLCRGVALRAVFEGDVIMRQGDAPSEFPYYCAILRGSMCIFAKDLTADPPGHGDFLNRMDKGQAFGELAFLNPGVDSARAATVISDGDGSFDPEEEDLREKGLRGNEEEEREDRGDLEKSEHHRGVRNAKPAILVLISHDVYTRRLDGFESLFDVQSRKYQFQNKVAFLRKLLLFQTWSYDRLIKLAFATTSRSMERGAYVVRQDDDRSQFVFIIASGEVTLSIKRKYTQHDKITGSFVKRNASVDVAVLGESDMFGLIELTSDKAVWQRSAMCTATGELFCVRMHDFRHVCMNNQAVKRAIMRLVQRRQEWENLRLQFTTQFPEIRQSLTQGQMTMAKYRLETGSICSTPEMNLRKSKELALTALLRESRAALRSAHARARHGDHHGALEWFDHVIRLCGHAKSMANMLGDSERAVEAETRAAESANEQHRQNDLANKKGKPRAVPCPPNNNARPTKPARSAPTKRVVSRNKPKQQQTTTTSASGKETAAEASIPPAQRQSPSPVPLKDSEQRGVTEAAAPPSFSACPPPKTRSWLRSCPRSIRAEMAVVLARSGRAINNNKDPTPPSEPRGPKSTMNHVSKCDLRLAKALLDDPGGRPGKKAGKRRPHRGKKKGVQK